MTSPWRKGWQLENDVQKDLLKHGYIDVHRSPLSRGPWDVTGIKRGVRLYIQCKRAGEGQKPKLSPQGWNALFEFCEAQGAVPLVAGRQPYKPITYHLMTRRKRNGGYKQPWRDFDLGTCPPKRRSAS